MQTIESGVQEIMIIDCISDLHGHFPKLEGGDLLIVAGDLTANDTEHEYVDKFLLWLIDQHMTKYEKIIWIAGNHDNWVQENISLESQLSGGEYLCDSGTEFEYEVEISHPASTEHVSIDVLCFEKRKLKIWGSPWTLRFKGMNPHAMAFTVDTEEELAEKWALIPEDIDILVTHSPPYGLLDVIQKQVSVGSISLRNVAFNLENLKLFVFGHIHEMGGRMVDLTCMKVINASHVNERYEPVNKPIRIEL